MFFLLYVCNKNHPEAVARGRRSGKVITSILDGSNATIRDMNNHELQSSDDEIIQTLESNKRHTLIKDYDNGDRKEKTVFKTN